MNFVRKIDSLFRRRSDSESDSLLASAPSTRRVMSDTLPDVTTVSSSEHDSRSEQLSAARITAPSTGPALCPETSFPFVSLEESCVVSPVQQPSEVTSLPSKMADNINPEGNIISLKVAPVVSPPVIIPAKTTLSVPAQSPPIATQERKPSVKTQDRHVWKQRASLREMAAAPKTGGVKLPRSEPEMLRDKSESVASKVCELLLDWEDSSIPHATAETAVNVDDPSSQEDKEELEGKVYALKNALDIKDTEMKVLKAAHKVQIENLQGKFSQSVPVLSVPMPAAPPPPVKSCVCSREMEEYRLALESEVEATNKRFLAMYHHARHLAEEVTQQNLLISALQHSESIATTLVADQKVVVQSTLALVKKERRTKFTTAYTVSYSVTAPQPEVYEQISEASIRLLEEQRRMKREEVAQLAMKVDQLARVYSPAKYDLTNPSNATKPKVVDDVENLPESVPAELFAIWMCQQGEVELTPAEEQKFAWFMTQQIRPPPIYSPTMKKPRVDWTKVNRWKLRDLPEAHTFPVLSVPQDPDFYKTTFVKKYGSVSGEGRCNGTPHACGCLHCRPPFGQLHGLRSNYGIIAMPSEPVHGYVWTNRGGWVLYAGGTLG